MISNKKAILGAVIVAVIASLFTLNAGIMLGKVAIVPVDRYGEYKKFEKLLALKQEIEGNFYQEPDEGKLIEGAVNGMFEGLEDPYSDYMTEEEFNELIELTKGSFGGIGVYVAPGEDGFITIISPIEDTPGDRAGLKAGDKIIKVDGEAFAGNELDKAIVKMKGEPGTSVTLTIFREGMDEPFDVNIVREEIQVKTVKSEIKDGDIGYIRITTFAENTAGEFRKNLEDLKGQGIKGLVIDLRSNPGGLLDQCHEIADEILGKGTVVYTRERSGKEEYLKSDDERKLSMPIAVLVNEWSASASEILSGAIRDNNAGVLIGETTFGKGLVQRVYPLKDGTGYKLTTAQYFTPSGEYINKKGIKPDIEVEDEQEQLDKALEYIKDNIK